ncbi:MAG: DUF4174 domain-containing protein [Xanthomonadales bacterium]|nr:DUF4174 domain-containing protein [Xanthomonadales bacterium]
MANASEPEDPLGELRWKARVLLVFSPSAGDTRSTAFLQAADAAACAVAERDMVIGRISPAGTSFLGENTIAPSDAAALRQRFGIAPEAFRILLVGKDGGVKGDYQRPPSLSVVFDLVDSMPMRRQEMRTRSTSC